ncbi:MAG: hypothetical protein ABI263_00595 [Gelidibacter sp.]
MKKLVVLMICCFSASSFSQNEEIIGSYYMSSGNPEGGTTLYIMPNNTFVVGYFGGLQKGTWEFKEDAYHFTYHKEPKIVLYGRHNPSLKDSVSVNMSVDSNGEFAVRFNPEENIPFTPIFNRDANCMDYPYIYKQKEVLHTLEVHLPDLRYYYEETLSDLSEIYRFKSHKGFNEFILTGLSTEYSAGGAFQATYGNGILSLNNGEDNLKKNGSYEDFDEETLGFITQHTEMEIFPELLEYGNEFFPYYENPTQTDIKPFTRIDVESLASKNIKFSEKSLFIATCENRN